MGGRVGAASPVYALGVLGPVPRGAPCASLMAASIEHARG